MAQEINTSSVFRPAKSSLIRTAEYDRGTGLLVIKLHSGRVYGYFDVKQTTFDSFRKSNSAGAFYNQHIRSVGESEQFV